MVWGTGFGSLNAVGLLQGNSATIRISGVVDAYWVSDGMEMGHLIKFA